MKMTNIRLGINNAFASKRWPEPMAWSRLIAGDLGLTEVQFSFDLLDPLLPEPGPTPRPGGGRGLGTRRPGSGEESGCPSRRTLLARRRGDLLVALSASPHFSQSFG